MSGLGEAAKVVGADEDELSLSNAWISCSGEEVGDCRGLESCSGNRRAELTQTLCCSQLLRVEQFVTSSRVFRIRVVKAELVLVQGVDHFQCRPLPSMQSTCRRSIAVLRPQ